MDKKVTGILSYITIIGWLIAYIAGDKEGAKVHLNQGLVLIIIGLVGWVIGWIPLLGWIIKWLLNIVVVVYVILGIIWAATDKEELPIISAFKLLK